MPFEQSNLPLDNNKEFSHIASSLNRDVLSFTEDDTEKDYVVKIVKTFNTKLVDESEEDYYQRRLEEAYSIIATKSKKELEVRELLAEVAPNVFVPREFYFIFNDNSGLPTVASIQEKVEGNTLKEYGVGNLTVEQLLAIADLLKADNLYYSKHGTHFDLRGTSTKDSAITRVQKVLFGYIKNSINIMVTDSGDIAFVDSDPFTDKNSFKSMLVKLDNTRIKSLIRRRSISN